MRLINRDGDTVKVGDLVSTGDEFATVTGWAEPTHSGSSGRIHTTLGHGEHFPNVFGCKFVSDAKDGGTLTLGIYESPAHGVLYIVKEDGKLKAGTATNTGITYHFNMDIDDVFSLDENLQAFTEYIEEQKS